MFIFLSFESSFFVAENCRRCCRRGRRRRVVLLYLLCVHIAQLRLHLIRCCCLCIIRFKPRCNNTHVCAECDRFIFYLLFSDAFLFRSLSLFHLSLSFRAFFLFLYYSIKPTEELILYEKNK